MEIIEIENLILKISKTNPNYAVSKCGRVFRVSTKKEMTQSYRTNKEVINGMGNSLLYLYVRCCHNNKPKNVPVHRLVAECWVDGKSDARNRVNHIDGNKINNHYTNLEWVTDAENQRHALTYNLKGKGDQLYNASLSDAEVYQICIHLQDGWRVTDIASKFDVTKDVVRKIRAGDTYFHIRQQFDIPHKYDQELSEATVRWVCEKIVEGVGDQVIANLSTNSNVKRADVKRIRHKIRYKTISKEYF